MSKTVTETPTFEFEDGPAFEIEEISAEYVQCQDCSWIGKTEHALMPPGYGGLLSCPACSCMSIEEYTGPKTVEIPIELLSAVNSKLITAQIYLCDEFIESSEMRQIQRECIIHTWSELLEFMKGQGLLIDEDDE
ncbi:hypothetical protein [Adonisia turfae]|nr:hypothetical protein [Adonisia turfae]